MDGAPGHGRADRTFGDRYALEERIGRGGTAEVWRGRDLRLGRPIAVKVLSGPASRDETHRRRIEREAQALARVSHPNVVAIYDYGEDTSAPGTTVPYIVMELVDGPDLARRLAEHGPLSVDDTLRVLGAVLDAIAEAHGIGIVHGDLKAANVFLDSDGPKVGDFGVARILAEETGTTTISATPAYAAPEILRGRRPTIASDLYSAACIAFEALAGHPPYTGQTLSEVSSQHLEAPIPSVLSVRRDVPEALDAAIRRGLAKEPSERFGSAASFAAALRAVEADVATAVPAPAAPAEPTRPQQPEPSIEPPAPAEPAPPAVGRPAADVPATPRAEPDAEPDDGPPPDHATGVPEHATTNVIPPATRTPAADPAIAPPSEPPVIRSAPVPSTPPAAADARGDQTVAGATVPVEPYPTEVLGRAPATPPATARIAAAARRVPVGILVAVGAVALLIGMQGQSTATVEVPDLSGVPLEQAQTVAANHGFRTETTEVQEGGAPGTVVGQDPAPGALHRRGTTIVLRITIGVPQAVVPDVSGLTLEEAQGRIAEAKLAVADVVFDLDRPRTGTVAATDPPAGTTLDAGTAIRVVVAPKVVDEPRRPRTPRRPASAGD